MLIETVALDSLDSDTTLRKPVEIEYGGNSFNRYTWFLNKNKVVLAGIKNREQLIQFLNVIYLYLTNYKPLGLLVGTIGVLTMEKLATEAYPEELNSYFRTFSNNLIGADYSLMKSQLVREIFDGNEFDIARRYYKPFIDMLTSVLTDTDIQNRDLKIKSNSINFEQDRWTLFIVNGSKLQPVHFVYSDLPSHSVKHEVKHYFKSILDEAEAKDYRNISHNLTKIKTGLIFLLDKYPHIKYIANISQTDVRWLILHLQTAAKTRQSKGAKTYSPSTINKIINQLKLMVDWLMEEDITSKTRSPRPRSNIFAKFRFPNLSSMKEDTDYIPEEVIEQLLEHLDDLSDIKVQRMLLIMLNTGLRYKEVQCLEYDCLDYDANENIWILTYVPWKTLEARKAHGLSEYAITTIKDFVAAEIQLQIRETEDMRQIWSMKEIFIQYYSQVSPSLYKSDQFNRKINALIQKYNIIDLNGSLWHFTSKQCRKTVAVDMILNGATRHEVAQKLGHLKEDTTSIHYITVRKMKLADLNHKFYQKKFGSYISEDQLRQYTKEERKILYVQFCLGEREVELGKCTKHPNDGACSKRSGKVNCANCNKLCTGKQNLPRWLALKDEAQKRVNALIEEYKRDNIPDYEDYREYQNAIHELKTYLDAIEKINTGDNT